MTIKGLNDDKLYLLAHLSDYKKDEGNIVEPNDIVAIAGDTGYSTAEHLHLEVFVGVPDDKRIVLGEDGYQRHPGKGYVRPTNPSATIKRVNPFNHEEGEWVWAGSRL